jgi:CBS-domain-containing membrane protein
LYRRSQISGRPSILVFDPAVHVVGMITQVDLISGLYRLGVVKARLHS